ncbi:RNA-dependent RNA polymerase 6, partial [Tanacetum coccineum]
GSLQVGFPAPLRLGLVLLSHPPSVIYGDGFSLSKSNDDFSRVEGVLEDSDVPTGTSISITRPAVSVSLEVGLLGNRDTFFVGWRGADSGVDFLIDPFDRSCKFLSRKIPLFLSKEQGIMQTADDDIHTTHPSEMLDDDDPWIRTTDFTPSGAIGRCNTYRVLIRARDKPKAKTALAFLEGQPKVNIEHPVTELKCSGTVVKPMRDGGADHRPE